jgi:hypothetical protein
MTAVARSRILRASVAAAVLVLGGLGANACSLNPQPLPPDQPTDAGVVNGPRAPDSGSAFASAADAGTAAVDAGTTQNPGTGGGKGGGPEAGTDGETDGQTEGGEDAHDAGAADSTAVEASVSDSATLDSSSPDCSCDP